MARGGILREGLGYDRNDVAVVTNVTGDHLGLGGIDSLGQLANVKGVVVEAVPRSGTAVLNADDPHVARMGRHCAGRVVYFTMATEKGQDGYDRVDGHLGRAGPLSASSPAPWAISSSSASADGRCPSSTPTSSRPPSAGGPG